MVDIKIKIGDYELTYDEAKQIYEELKLLFEKSPIIQYSFPRQDYWTDPIKYFDRNDSVENQKFKITSGSEI